MAIALTVLPTLPLWSQTTPAANPAEPAVVATSGTYTTVPCDQVSNVPGENKQDDPLTLILGDSLFAPGAEEGKDYECGYLTVPEVHSQPQGKQIQVAIAIVKSTNPQPSEPLILFQGGPGGSSLDIFPLLLSSPTDQSVQKLRAQRDLIAFEKRGNHYSKPQLNCPEYKESESGDTPEDDAKELASLKSCRDRPLIAPGTRWLGQSLFDLSWQTIVQRVVVLLVLILFPVVWLGMMLVAGLNRRSSGAFSAPVAIGAGWAPWLGVLLAVLSLSWILVQVYEVGTTLFSFGYGSYSYEQLLVGVDRKYAWIYILPIGIALLSIGMLVFAILSWKQSYWGKARRFYYSFTAGVAIAYTLFLGVAGQLTVFL